jgi:hypothetical protein
MAVAFDIAASVVHNTGASFTISHTIGSVANPVLVVHVAIASATVTVSSVSWDLGSGTTVGVLRAALSGSGAGAIEIWTIPAPVTGAGTITVNLSASAAFHGVSHSFSGADQTTPASAADNASSQPTGSQTSVTETPANLTANDASSGGGINIVAGNPSSVTPNQTYLNNSGAVNMETGYAIGTGGITFNWDIALTVDALGAAIRIIAASAGGGDTLFAQAIF